MQSSTQPAGNANRLSAELARPRIIPHPTKGTIEFEHGQNVAKLGKMTPIVNGPFHAMPFRPSTALSLDRIGGTHDWRQTWPRQVRQAVGQAGRYWQICLNN
jgi:hypothetical protein